MQVLTGDVYTTSESRIFIVPILTVHLNNTKSITTGTASRQLEIKSLIKWQNDSQ